MENKNPQQVRKKYTFADFKNGIIGLAAMLIGLGYIFLRFVFKVI